MLWLIFCFTKSSNSLYCLFPMFSIFILLYNINMIKFAKFIKSPKLSLKIS